MNSEEEYTGNEVLTGAELYLYLLRQNEEQQVRAQAKLNEYTALKDTLQVLTERSRRRVLAPVAGGLAYFPAELNATNTITVLLGDSWFAERSAVQASEIASRRLDFLRREAEVLKQEESALRSKQDFFLSEMPEAQDAVAQLLADQDARHAGLVGGSVAPSSAAAPPAPPANTSAIASSQPHLDAGAKEHGATAASSRAAMQPPPSIPAATAATASPTAAAAPPAEGAELDYAAVDAALATFDEQDELTEDELIALEKELGDRLDDDAYVEQVMTERMIAKKEQRVKAELARRQAAALATPGPELAQSGGSVEEVEATKLAEDELPSAPPLSSPPSASLARQKPAITPSASTETSAAATTTTTFRTPADIFTMLCKGNDNPNSLAPSAGSATSSFSGAQHADPAVNSTSYLSHSPLAAPPAAEVREAAATLPTSTTTATPNAESAVASPTASTCSSSSSRKDRHVRFHDDVKPEAMTSAVTERNTDAASASADVTAGEAATDPASLQQSPSLLRSTYRIGEIVEHIDEQTTAAQPPPPLLPTYHQKPKRKSLFMRDLEGDSAQ